MSRKLGAACPLCGDPTAFPLWVDEAPPPGCAYDEAWMDGGEPVITAASECYGARARAWQAAEFRKLVPDAFDENGNIKPGGLGRVLEAFAAAHPGRALVLP